MDSESRIKILIVDDELPICRNCVKILSRPEYDVRYALDGYEALKQIEETDFEIVVTDLKMNRIGGMEVLRKIRESSPDTRVIVITGYAGVSSAVEVMKSGAYDYLPKPFTPHELRSIVSQALAERDIDLRNRFLMEASPKTRTVSHQLVGDSPRLQKVIKMVRKVAPTGSTVLLFGESGTGKELIARAIHVNSPRKDKVFYAVDCGALSESLLESELFGHAKGAFTGAHQDKEGIFSAADGGTIFLDEISNISINVQGKLLRFLESREFTPLGSTSPRRVDIRMVFATNKNLSEMVDEGSFREDFYYRIHVYPIHLPPLRQRPEDILPIAYHFLDQIGRRMDKPVKGFGKTAVDRMMLYDWPGNVRQLRNVIERAVILCEKDTITLKDLPLFSEIGDPDTTSDFVPVTNEELKKEKKRVKEQAVSDVEIKFLLNALDENGWNVTQAAKNTGIQRTNFQALMKKHGIKLSMRNRNSAE